VGGSGRRLVPAPSTNNGMCSEDEEVRAREVGEGWMAVIGVRREGWAAENEEDEACMDIRAKF